MSACDRPLPGAIGAASRPLSMLVERIGPDAWLVRRSAAVPDRWIVLSHAIDEPGQRMALELVKAAGDENWWVLAVPLAPRQQDTPLDQSLRDVALALGQGRGQCLRGMRVPHFDLVGCGDGAVAAQQFTSLYPERVVRLVLLPGAEFRVSPAQGGAGGCYGLLRTPLQVFVPAQGALDRVSARKPVTAPAEVGRVDEWLRQLRRMAFRRGLQLDCQVVELALGAEVRPLRYLQQARVLGAIGAFFRGQHRAEAPLGPGAGPDASPLQFML